MSRTRAYVIFFIAALVALVFFIRVVKDHDELEAQAASLKSLQQRLDQRPPPTPPPPHGGEVVQIARKRHPFSSYVLKLEGRTRGDECYLEPDDVKLTVLDVRESWVMLRFERSGPQGGRPAGASYETCPGFDGILAMRAWTFQDYRARAEAAEADRDQEARTLRDFYEHFPTPIP
jgi:hypothetical protein